VSSCAAWISFATKSLVQLCFDPEGNLSKAAVGELNITFEYSDYRPEGQKFVPHKVILKREGRVVLEAEVDDVSTGEKTDPNLFEPAPGAIKRSGCFAPTLPRMTKTAFPKYPLMARSTGQEGIVTIYVLIASDGSVRNSKVIETAGKELDEAALSVMPQLQYEPAKCGDVAVDFETTLGLRFSLQYP
jgi:TonB family protein